MQRLPLLIVIALAAVAQKPARMEIDPVADLNGRFVWGLQRPDQTKACTVEKEIIVYPVAHISVPGAVIDDLDLHAKICVSGHWRTVKLGVE
jgi:hypothetical protein